MGAMWRAELIAALSLVILVSLVSAQSASSSFPFIDFARGDSTALPIQSDGISRAINVPNGFAFGNETQTTIYVTTDGYLSFGRSVSCCPTLSSNTSTSTYIVAPFLADTNVASGTGNVTYQVHTNTSSQALLNKVSKYIRQSEENAFSGTWMLAIQWENVPRTGQSTSLTNTFQGVVVTNGFQSYALFTYECGKLQWSGNADIGFKANSRLFDIHTMSGSTANSIACVNSPDSIWSNLIYQLHLKELPFINLDETKVLLSSSEEDVVSGSIEVQESGFPFGNSRQTTLFVSTNGLISFGRSFKSHSPYLFPETSFYNYLVAPFWSDNDITNGVGEVSYQTYNNSQSEALTYVSTYIKQQHQVNFTGTWMLIAEWKNVPEYLGATNTSNTYQGIVVTDGQFSYSIFTYNCLVMDWSGRASIGVNADGNFFQNNNFSRQSNARNIACTNSPNSNWHNVMYMLYGDYLDFIALIGTGSPTTLASSLDSQSGVVTIPNVFPFGIQNTTTAYVSSNGVMTFNRSINFFSPVLFPNSTSHQYMVAPFWADHDPRPSGKISFKTYSNNSDTLSTVSRFIRQQTSTTFAGSWMLLAKWEDIAEYGAEDDKTNSYEGLVITNGTESYAVFTYLCGALSWHGNATVGFNAGGTLFRNYPDSGTNSVHSIACTNYSRTAWTNIVYKLTPNGINIFITYTASLVNLF